MAGYDSIKKQLKKQQNKELQPRNRKGVGDGFLK